MCKPYPLVIIFNFSLFLFKSTSEGVQFGCQCKLFILVKYFVNFCCRNIVAKVVEIHWTNNLHTFEVESFNLNDYILKICLYIASTIQILLKWGVMWYTNQIW
jgi:hypothetical protein